MLHRGAESEAVRLHHRAPFRIQSAVVTILACVLLVSASSPMLGQVDMDSAALSETLASTAAVYSGLFRSGELPSPEEFHLAVGDRLDRGWQLPSHPLELVDFLRAATPFALPLESLSAENLAAFVGAVAFAPADSIDLLGAAQVTCIADRIRRGNETSEPIDLPWLNHECLAETYATQPLRFFEAADRLEPLLAECFESALGAATMARDPLEWYESGYHSVSACLREIQRRNSSTEAGDRARPLGSADPPLTPESDGTVSDQTRAAWLDSLHASVTMVQTPAFLPDPRTSQLLLRMPRDAEDHGSGSFDPPLLDLPPGGDQPSFECAFDYSTFPTLVDLQDELAANANLVPGLGPVPALPGNRSAKYDRGGPPDLNCWLREHPEIAQWIAWAWSDNPLGDGSYLTYQECANTPQLRPFECTLTPQARGIYFKSWESWEQTRKDDLREAFESYWSWYNRGLTGADPQALADPPSNLLAPQLTLKDDGYLYSRAGVPGKPYNIPNTILSYADAWHLYVGHVASALALEIGNWLPWSMASAKNLPEGFVAPRPELWMERLLPGWEFFVYYNGSHFPNGGYLPRNLDLVIPPAPYSSLKFLLTHRLIGPSHRQTILALTSWSRLNFEHQWGVATRVGYDGYTLTANRAHWQYHGWPPMIRMLQGTKISQVTDPQGQPLVDPQFVGWFKHWINGCGGSSGYYRSLLRAINVPFDAYLAPFSNHFLPHFPSISMALSHGDDPYFSRGLTPLAPDMEDLLVNEGSFFDWFAKHPINNTGNSNIGRGVADFMLASQPFDGFQNSYCKDVGAGRIQAGDPPWVDGEPGAGFETGMFYRDLGFDHYFTVAEFLYPKLAIRNVESALHHVSEQFGPNCGLKTCACPKLLLVFP